MKLNKYSLPLRVSAVMLLVLSLATMAAAALAVIYGIDQGYYERDYNNYFETDACRYEARDLAHRAWSRSQSNSSLTRQEVMELYYSDSLTNARIALHWPDGTVTRNYPEDGGRFLYSETFPVGDGGTEATVSLTGELTVRDGFFFGAQLHRLIYYNRNAVFALTLGGVLGAVLTVAYLCAAAGRDYKDGHLRAGLMDIIPLDLLFVGEVVIFVVTVALLSTGLQVYRAWGLYLTTFFLWVVIIALDIMTIAARVKLRTLWTNTVIWWCISACWRTVAKFLRFCLHCIRAIPMVWRGALLLVALLGAYGIVSLAEPELMLIGCFLLCLLGIWGLNQLNRLKQAGQALAEGNVEYKTDTRRMIWDLKKHGENLNSVGDGLLAAVARQTKSERLKAELITNVSHDIKTPLTSIVNYVDLLQKPHTEEQQAEYLAVLDRQAKRLKKLTEDLVEASKASTGNIAADILPTNLGELLEQALAEYGSRLEQADLHLVRTLPEERLSALADGKLLWRVLDNLLGNVCKYALPDTRVYVSLDRVGDHARIQVKNISREELNISADELTERFVRGDRARLTEGSGLGLNIARSLVELQHGTFDLEIDGDLFKAVVTLPLVPSMTEE